MFRNNRIPLIAVLALFVVLIVVQHYSPKPTDWNVSCNLYSKSPYGCYVQNDLLKTIFPEQVLKFNTECFAASLDTTISEPQNIIVITPEFKPDKYDVKALLAFVSKGNQLFISSSGIADTFLDSLKVKITGSALDSSIFKPGKETLFLKNPPQNCDSTYCFDRRMPRYSFSTFDSANVQVLGTNRNGGVNFIGMKKGKGRIYLHSQPLVFTNYHLLYGNVEYASVALSYLPVQQTVWDSYYKPDRFVNSSPTRYILTQPALKSAYYLLLFTLLLYMVVESKRRQRIIPIIKVPENRSLEYVKTIGGLYFKQHDNADLAKKKVIYFKEFMREHYFISNLSNTPECIWLVTSKTGVKTELVSRLLAMVQQHESANKVPDESLIDFHHQLELFYEQCL